MFLDSYFHAFLIFLTESFFFHKSFLVVVLFSFVLFLTFSFLTKSKKTKNTKTICRLSVSVGVFHFVKNKTESKTSTLFCFL